MLKAVFHRSTDTWLRLGITVLALAGLVLHLFFPRVKLDTATLVLLGVALLPWLSSLVRSAKFPGGFEIEFQDLQAAAERVGVAGALAPRSEALPSWQAVQELDPNLALVGLRIEIERRLRDLAKRHLDVYAIPLPRLIERLVAAGALSAGEGSGLTDIVLAGNQAAHGASVDPSVREWAQLYGPRVLRVLDARLAQAPDAP